MVSLEVWVVKIIVGPTISRVLIAHYLLEAVQVELPDEAGEIVGLKAVVSVDFGGQNLTVEELVVDDDQITLAVPANGFDLQIIHQTPEFSWKNVGADGLLHVLFPELETGFHNAC